MYLPYSSARSRKIKSLVNHSNTSKRGTCMKTRFWSFCLCFTCAGFMIVPDAVALDNGLAQTPPMGWNSWYWFFCNDENHGTLDEAGMKGIVDALIASGMKDAGYEYINYDDCWAESARPRPEPRPLQNSWSGSRERSRAPRRPRGPPGGTGSGRE